MSESQFTRKGFVVWESKQGLCWWQMYIDSYRVESKYIPTRIYIILCIIIISYYLFNRKMYGILEEKTFETEESIIIVEKGIVQGIEIIYDVLPELAERLDLGLRAMIFEVRINDKLCCVFRNILCDPQIIGSWSIRAYDFVFSGRILNYDRNKCCYYRWFRDNGAC